MSYDELDSIRDQGFVAIVSLCGELSDLHEIEVQSGFEVCFLPTPDECAPDMEKMKEALEWLDAREASIENPTTIDLLPFFHDYEALQAEAGAAELDTAICIQPFDLQLVEAVYVSHIINSKLSCEKRNVVLERALKTMTPEKYSCPLFEENNCLIYEQRPLRCRTVKEGQQKETLEKITTKISRDIFLALTDSSPSDDTLHFSFVDTVSGRFVQQYFQVMRDKKEA